MQYVYRIKFKVGRCFFPPFNILMMPFHHILDVKFVIILRSYIFERERAQAGKRGTQRGRGRLPAEHGA